MAEDGRINLSAHLFRRYAREYLKCSECYKPELLYSPVPYLLLCRAIEFELKAIHLESMSRDEIKHEYGHDLKVAYDDLPDAQRTLDGLEYARLCVASQIYDDKGFEYLAVRTRHWP